MTTPFSMDLVLLIFYVVFAAQIGLISVYFPLKLRGRILYVIDHYPVEDYPKFYPAPFDSYAKNAASTRMPKYLGVNFTVAGLGLIVLVIMALNGYQPALVGGDEIFVIFYFLLQFFAMFYPILLEYNHLKLLRETYTAGSIRTANLTPRRLIDYVPPAYVILAVALFIAWVGSFVLMESSLLQQETAILPIEVVITIVGITGLNLVYCWMIFRKLSGQAANPHQPSMEQEKQIELTVKSLVLTSIAISLFLIATNLADHFRLEVFDPPLTSFYLQLCVLLGLGMSFQMLRVSDLDFEVYR